MASVISAKSSISGSHWDQALEHFARFAAAAIDDDFEVVNMAVPFHALLHVLSSEGKWAIAMELMSGLLYTQKSAVALMKL